jgi:hypothetical protein
LSDPFSDLKRQVLNASPNWRRYASLAPAIENPGAERSEIHIENRK